MSDISATPAPDGFLRMRQLRELTGLGKSTIYDRIKRSEFPAPYDLGGGVAGWRRSELQTWLDNRQRRSP